MSIQDLFVQQFSKLFHHHSEAPSPELRQERAAVDSISADERNRLVAAARLAILELEAKGKIEDDSRRYFAKPGEAEWGC